MVKCAIPFCGKSTDKGYRLVSFPKNPIRRQLWMQHIQHNHYTLHIPYKHLPLTFAKYSRICEAHFAPEAWYISGNRKKLRPDAVPTLFGLLEKPCHAIKLVWSVSSNCEIRNEAVNEQVNPCVNVCAVHGLPQPSIPDPCHCEARKIRYWNFIKEEYRRLTAENKKYKESVNRQRERLLVVHIQMQTLRNKIKMLQEKS